MNEAMLTSRSFYVAGFVELRSRDQKIRPFFLLKTGQFRVDTAGAMVV